MLETLFRPVWRFLKQDDGPTAVEYAVMIGLIIAVVFATVATVGNNTSNSLSYTGTKTAKAGS
jgi:pilus assembly protein Flp/PilA